MSGAPGSAPKDKLRSLEDDAEALDVSPKKAKGVDALNAVPAVLEDAAPGVLDDVASDDPEAMQKLEPSLEGAPQAARFPNEEARFLEAMSPEGEASSGLRWETGTGRAPRLLQSTNGVEPDGDCSGGYVYQCKTIFGTFIWAILHTTRLVWGPQRCRNVPTRPKSSCVPCRGVAEPSLPRRVWSLTQPSPRRQALVGRGSCIAIFYLKMGCPISRTFLAFC